MTARPRIESPTARESLAFVAAASIPGSIEARLVYQCTCAARAAVSRRGRMWKPDQLEGWLGVLCLSCPAHGRLLERHVARVRSPEDSGVRRLGEPHTPVMHELRRRSLFVRVAYVVRGWLGEW
jgi:hypothetical protein